MRHEESNCGRRLPDAPMVSALTRYRGYHRAWPLLVVAAVFASLAVDAVAQDGVATDRAALGALYDATGGETWGNSTNWKTDAPLGQWYGVATGAGGRVTRLSLGRNALTGPIPEVLGGLSNLSQLSLSNNALTGPIPDALGRLSNLTGLYLNNNALTGPIPEVLGGLSNLTSLNLGGNELTGPIPDALGRLSNLERLYLYNNGLTGPIPEVLGGLSNLTSLNLGGNELTGPIPDALGRLSNLEWLYLNNNALTGPIPEVLGGLSNLTGLYLNNNALTGPIPSELTRLSRLTRLEIQNTGLCAPADNAFQEWLAPIDFSGSTCRDNRSPEAVAMIPAQTLTVGGAALGVGVAGYFRDDDPLSYEAASSHEDRVTVSVSGSIVWLAPGEAGTSTVTVTARDSGGLSATRTMAVTVVVSSGPQSDYEVLAALYGATGGPTWTDSTNWKSDAPLGEWYGVTTGAGGRVTNLNLGGNALAGPIPDALGSLSNLTYLNLVRNALSGPIPDALGSLSNLTGLSLFENALAGPIPDALGDLSNLERLALSFNELTGPIPDALGSLSNLQALNLGGNELTGPIPDALGNLSNLTWLSLSENALSGPIPDALGSLSNLTYLNLVRNALSGPIPDALGSLSNLTGLSLFENALAGPIPDALGDLSNLERLALSFNELTGPIPDALGGLSNLESLDLRWNALSGPIPDALGSLSNLQVLDLSDNWGVSGELPDGLRLSRLRELDIGVTQACAPVGWRAWVRTIDFFGAPCGVEADVTIDVAIVYTPAAREAAGGTPEIEAVIDLMVAETNQAYADSGVRHRMALVARSEVPYTETGDSFIDFDRLRNPSDGYMDEAHALREASGADLMHLLFDEGNVGGYADGAFGLTCQRCGGVIFAHETGHNLGLSHDRYETHNHLGWTLPPHPAYGYVNQRAFDEGAPPSSLWHTVMAYSTQCRAANKSCLRLLRFSNPRQTWLGDPLGVAYEAGGFGVDGPADAVAVLNAMGPAVAARRDRPPPGTESFSIPNLGGWSTTSSGNAETVRAGYGRIRADAASTAPSGIAIFQYRNSDGVLIAEAGVPAAQLVFEGRIFAEVNGPANTGVAIANPNEVPATIRFYITDGDGIDSGHDSFQLGAGEQTARLLDTDPFHISGPFVGTLTFTSPVPVAVIALRGLTNEANEWLMTTLPVAPLSPSAWDTVYFPHFADGGGWATEVVLVNPTDLTIAGTVGFLGPGDPTTAGAPVVLTLDDGSAGSEFDYTIAPRSFRRFTTSNRLGELKSGSVRATPDAGSAAPSGLVIFSYATGEKTLAEAGVPVSPEGTAFRVPVDAFGTPNQPGSIRTGLAVANTADVFNTVTLEVTRRDGTLAASPATLTLPPSGQAARMLDEILTLPADFSGLLRVRSVVDVSVIALRLRINELGELKVTTTTPSNETAVATSEDRFFAHFADSRGWTTEFILFSGTAGQPASGTLRFFGDAGQPLDLTGAQP